MDDEHLDESWLKQFKDAERPYEGFYKEAVVAVDVILVFVSSDREVASVVKEKHHLLNEGGLLPKANLVELIRANERRNGVAYRIDTIAKYNFTVDPDEVISMDTIDAKRYFHAQKYNGDVVFEDTIALFQDVNALFLIFNEKNARTRLTKHVRFHKPVRYTRRQK